MTRRDLLKYGVGLVGTLAVGGAAAAYSRSAAAQSGHGQHDPRDPPDPPDIIEDAFAVAGRRVQIGRRRRDQRLLMVLDGRTISEHAFGQLARNRFASHLLPFQEFSSARGLARALVEGDRRLFRLTP